MSEKGWIPVYRSVTQHSIWEDKPFSKGQAWIDLLMRASYKSKKVIIGNQMVEIHPGEFITSDKKLMDAWGWGKEKVRSFLKILEADEMITRKPERKWTAISIVNWNKYQIVQTDSRPLSDQQQTDSRPLSDSINKLINKQNIGIGYNYTSMAEAVGAAPLPSQTDLDRIVNTWNQIPHAIRLSGIAPMTKRYDKLREALAIVGMDGVMQAIQSVKDSDWLRERGHVAFDRWITPDHIQSLIEGQYQDKFEKKEAVQHGSSWDFRIASDD